MTDVSIPSLNRALKLVRMYWGYSQTDLADELKISQSLISEVERGTKTVSMDLLERYSKNLEIRRSQLLFFAEELEDQPTPTRGKLIVARKVLDLLESLAPKENSNEPA